MATRISAKEAQDNFADLLDRVHYGKESVVVEDKGQAFVVVISPDEYERYQRLARDRFFEVVDEIQQQNEGTSPEEVAADVSAALDDVRQEGDGAPDASGRN